MDYMGETWRKSIIKLIKEAESIQAAFRLFCFV